MTKLVDFFAMVLLPLAGVLTIAFMLYIAHGDAAKLFMPITKVGYLFVVLAFAGTGTLLAVRRNAFGQNFIPWMSLGVIVYGWMAIVAGL